MAVDVETPRPLPLACDGNGRCNAEPSLLTRLPSTQIDIIDIRAGGRPLDLKESIRSGLREPDTNGIRSIPSLLLWNEQGLRYFEQVTYAPEYYLTNIEIQLLREHSVHLARNIEPGTIILELGSGCLRKTNVFLQAIEDLGRQADYYALDLDLKELDRTLQELEPNRFKHVRCHGLLGTYDDGKVWLSRGIHDTKPKYVLSLGSTMGSFTKLEASEFLGEWAHVLRQGNDGMKEAPDAKIIIGLDGSKDSRKVWSAYNDSSGANRRFILNALGNANEHLGYKAFNLKDWAVRGEWDVDGGKHVHHKYDDWDKWELWEHSQLIEVEKYMNDDRSYGLHVLSPNSSDGALYTVF
ncbi:hypothetical protein F4821DRAFT_257367 [Hypoxylon rubiginosum]|uniref:Uncharacterized protein n=1 Tax=Hypoxylon rubiginosum TaxID=110542 RepID=A0ACC0D9J9_9PEZI|nr:hypothetical protein F4821DRAFT_257367 [Hypoxylon rubiginosum]